MKLIDIITNIEDFSAEAIVFASLEDGKFHEESEASVLILSDEELKLKTTEVASNRCPRKSYFLEVFLIQEMKEEYFSNHSLTEANVKDLTKSVISYAVNDA